MQENAEKFSGIWYNKEYTEYLFYYELQFISRKQEKYSIIKET